MNLFKRMYYSMFHTKKYGELIQAGLFKIVLYGVLISGLTIAILFGASYLVFRGTYGTVDQMIEREIPEFELKDRSLHVDRPIFVNDGISYINIDTGNPGAFDGVNMDRVKRMSDDYVNLIIADREKMVFRFMRGEFVHVKFQDLRQDVYYSKQNIRDDVPFIKTAILMSFAVTGVFLMLLYFILLLIISVMEHFFLMLLGIANSISTVFKIAIHASTPVCLLFLFSVFFGFGFNVVSWAMVILLFVMMQTAMLNIQKQGGKLYKVYRSMEVDENTTWSEIEEFLAKDDHPASRKDSETESEDVDEECEADERGESSDYKRHQPDVIIPSSGWSFGKNEQTKE